MKDRIEFSVYRGIISRVGAGFFMPAAACRFVAINACKQLPRLYGERLRNHMLSLAAHVVVGQNLIVGVGPGCGTAAY